MTCRISCKTVHLLSLWICGNKELKRNSHKSTAASRRASIRSAREAASADPAGPKAARSLFSFNVSSISHILCKVLDRIHLLPQIRKERLNAFVHLFLALPAGEFAALAPAAKIGEFHVVLEHVEEV